MPASSNVLVLNKKIFGTHLKADALLRLLPRGAYTTARTVGKRGVFEFETHVKRTAASCASLIGDNLATFGGHLPSVATEAGLRSRLTASMQLATMALRSQLSGSFSQTSTDSYPNVKLTCLIVTNDIDVLNCCSTTGPLRSHLISSFDATSFDINTDDTFLDSNLKLAPLQDDNNLGGQTLLILHATLLPPRRLPPVKVVIAGAPRENALAKDSEWVRARTSLEASKGDDIEEVLLCVTEKERLRVLEGTQTNVFALIGDVIYTAGGSDVLEGTVRRLVLEVCAENNIPVILEAPTLGDSEKAWDGAFLTSTSRLVLPIDEMEWKTQSSDGSSRIHKQTFKPSERISTIERLVNSAAESHCSNIL